MTTTELKERATELKEMTGDFMREEITFTKLDFCLLGAVLFLAGICIGLLTAPWTHGISIASHNGSNNVRTDLKANEEESEEFED